MARTNKPTKKQEPHQTSKKNPSGPHAGWMKDPPVECIHRRKDSAGFWVESVICSFICKDEKCECHIELMKGSKSRIKGEQ